MSFSILSLSALARWHHLAILSIHLTPILSYFFTPTHTTETEGGRGEAGKNCLFLNRPPNLFGLGVIGHLHDEHSEVSAITTGL